MTECICGVYLALSGFALTAALMLFILCALFFRGCDEKRKR